MVYPRLDLHDRRRKTTETGQINMMWLEPDEFSRLPVDTPGSYVLFVHLQKLIRMAAGRLEERDYPAGWYGYVGSALSGLRQRLGRYTRPERKRRWHIDYLLEHGQVAGAMVVVSRKRLECHIAASLAERLETIASFGSSDCRCPGHLLHHRDERAIRKAVTYAFSERLLNWRREKENWSDARTHTDTSRRDRVER